MKPSERAHLASLLVAYDKALTEDITPELDAVGATPAVKAALDEAQKCLELLERVRRHYIAYDPVNEDADHAPSQLGRGRFRILRQLGRGGLGIVYLAQDTLLGREVAIKVPRGDVLGSADARRRFRREAAAAARLSHRNLVALYEVAGDGAQDVLVSEFCSGPNLSEWFSRRSAPLDPRPAARLVRELSEGVHHAHTRGVLHRDIKPSNVMLEIADSDESADAIVPRLTDFGMAKLLETADKETCSGAILGTPAYMAPEQVAGSRNLDCRADVYALGALLYELFTRRPPFQGESDADTVCQLVTGELTPPRRLNSLVPRDLEAVCLKCLAREPDRRYPTAQALADDLERFLAGLPTRARPPSPLRRLYQWVRRHPAVAALSLSACAALLALLAGAWFHNLRLHDEMVRANTALSAAQREADRNRRLVYAADIRLAHEAARDGHPQEALSLLDHHLPDAVQTDLREFCWYWLRAECNSPPTFGGHKGAVRGVAYAPDGQTLVSVGADHTVRLWDPHRRVERRRLEGHESEVLCLAVSQDGTLLATGSADWSVRLWSLPHGEPLTMFRGPLSPVLKVAISPDRRWLASGGQDGFVQVWDLPTREAVEQYELRSPVRHLEFANEGEHLILLGENVVRVLSSPGWTQVPATLPRSPGRHPRAPVPLGAERLGVWMGTEFSGWRWTSEGWEELPAWRSSEAPFASSSTGHMFATLSARGITLTTQDSGGEPFATFAIDSRIHSLRFSPAGDTLVGGDEYGRIGMWPVTAPPAPAPCMVHAADVAGSKLLWGACRDGHLRAWDLREGSIVTDWPLADQRIDAVRISHDGRFAAAAIRNGPLRIASVEGATSVFDRDVLRLVRPSFAWVPGTHRLAAAFERSVIAIIDAETGVDVQCLDIGAPVCDVAVTADGTRLLASTLKGLWVWSLKDGRFEDNLPGSFDRLTVSADGRRAWLAAGPRISRVNLETLHIDAEFMSTGSDVVQLAISPDGRTLAGLLGGPQRIQIWDADSHHPLVQLPCEEQAQLNSLGFTTDGARLVAAGVDAEYRGRLWQWRAR